MPYRDLTAEEEANIFSHCGPPITDRTEIDRILNLIDPTSAQTIEELYELSFYEIPCELSGCAAVRAVSDEGR